MGQQQNQMMVDEMMNDKKKQRKYKIINPDPNNSNNNINSSNSNSTGRGGMAPNSGTLAEKRVNDFTGCSQDMVTIISKVLHSMKDYGCFIGDKRFKQDNLNK